MPVSVPNRKGQILREATRLFSEDGYDKVTIKDLAYACGITEPALYRHFASKEAIYNSVLDSIEERSCPQQLFDKLGQESSVEAILKGLAQHVLDYFTKNQDLHRLMLFSALQEHSKAKRVYQIIRGSYINFLTTQFDRLYELGYIIRKNNQITARCFVGMVFDCALNTTLWRGYQGKIYNPQEVIANNIPIYVRGLES